MAWLADLSIPQLQDILNLSLNLYTAQTESSELLPHLIKQQLVDDGSQCHPELLLLYLLGRVSQHLLLRVAEASELFQLLPVLCVLCLSLGRPDCISFSSECTCLRPLSLTLLFFLLLDELKPLSSVELLFFG